MTRPRDSSFYVHTVMNAIMLLLLLVPPCASFLAVGHAVAGGVGVMAAITVMVLCLMAGAWLAHAHAASDEADTRTHDRDGRL